MQENTRKKLERDENGRLLPGQESLNPNGRPKGSLNFTTKFQAAIEKLAETDDISGEDLEIEIVQMAIKKAREGDYSFYRDTMDRVYGKPQQSIDHTSGGEKIETANNKLDSLIGQLEETNKNQYEAHSSGEGVSSE